MRQPKYMMGRDVQFDLEVGNSTVELLTHLRVTGVVCGVNYDPNCGTTGWPFYEYTVMPRGANKCTRVNEDKIYAACLETK